MSNISLGLADWIVVALYVAMTFGIALWVRRGQSNSSDFLLAGRSMPWIIVAISMYATLFSTISFVALPGEAYKHGMLLYLRGFLGILFEPLAVFIFLRYFYTAGTFTCYEYLERRYDLRVRLLGSCVFLLSRGLYGAVVLYASGQVFHAMLGWPPSLIIILAGGVAVAYTSIGGLRAEMIIDVFRSIILLSAIAVVLVTLSSLANYDFVGVWNYATDHGRTFGKVFEADFYSFDPTVRLTLWLFLLGGLMGPMERYGADQLVVQRLLASKTYEGAIRAVCVNAVVAPLMSGLFFATGLLLFYYYAHVNPQPIPISADHVFGVFIRDHLPTPVPGLVAAALLAAMMSTIDSTVNSLSTVTYVDLFKRLGVLGQSSEQRLLQVSKLLTIAWGTAIIAAGVGLVYIGSGVKSTVMEVAAVWSSLWGVLLMVVLAGIFTKWAKATPAVTAILVGSAINLALPWWLYYGTPEGERISFILIGLPGVAAAAIIVVVGSLLGSARRDLNSVLAPAEVEP